MLAVAMVLAATGVRAGGRRLLRRRGCDARLGALSLREAYDAIEWPILVMLGALIPVSEAMRTTGGDGTDRRLAVGADRRQLPAARRARADHGRRRWR